jgi:heme-degrading monooxygenase HmoA
MSKCFSTTNWQVKEGKQEEFIKRWTNFLNWTRETQDGLEAAQLVVDVEDPRRFVSVGEWRDSVARQAWQEAQRFTELFMPCLEVCDNMQGSQYEIKVTI